MILPERTRDILLGLASFPVTVLLLSFVPGLDTNFIAEFASLMALTVSALAVASRRVVTTALAMPTDLVVTHGADQGTTFRLDRDAILIGRGAPAQIVLGGDDRISRVHARLDRIAGHWYIEDLASTTGTYIGGYPIQGQVRLALNQAVRIGMSVFELRASVIAPTAGGPAPQP